jgi:hypothetical protein
VTWSRRATVFRNGALRSTALRPRPGRPHPRGHALNDGERPVESVDVQRRMRSRQCPPRRQGIREGYRAYYIGHTPWGRGETAAGFLHVTLGVDHVTPPRDERGIGRICRSRDPRGLRGAHPNPIRPRRSPSSPSDPTRSQRRDDASRGCHVRGDGGTGTPVVWHGPLCDFGGCGGPQSPTSNNLIFDVDLI